MLQRFGVAAALAFALAFAAGPVCAQSMAPPGDPAQQSFLAAVRLIELRDYAAAISILEPLAQSTEAPRVRLELARALYLDHQYKRSRREFLRVYARSDLPYSVRRNVDTFLTELDERAGYFAPSFGIEFNSNPSQQAGAGIYQVLGLPLLYLPDHSAKAWGFQAAAEGAVPIGRSAFSLVGGANGAAYTVRGASYVQAFASVRATRSNGWYAIGAGIYDQDLHDQVQILDVERMIRFPLGRESTLSIDTAVSRLKVTPNSSLDGYSIQAVAEYSLGLNRNAGLTVSAGGSYSSARDSIDSRWSVLGSAKLVRAAPKLRSVLILEGVVSRTTFGGVDPFFGLRRNDLDTTIQATLLRDAPFHGFFPGVSFTWNRRSSSIPFFSYSRRYASAQWRRRF